MDIRVHRDHRDISDILITQTLTEIIPLSSNEDADHSAPCTTPALLPLHRHALPYTARVTSPTLFSTTIIIMASDAPADFKLVVDVDCPIVDAPLKIILDLRADTYNVPHILDLNE